MPVVNTYILTSLILGLWKDLQKPKGDLSAIAVLAKTANTCRFSN
jgi:hypothetical protein